jgi:sterol desaturase/sphingolipid hydroxylase (fatty acid hydroxylase superfamily)
VFDNLIRKLEAVGAMLASPGSMFSLWQLGFAFGVAFAFLAMRHWRRRGRLRLSAIARAVFARRLLHNRSTAADAGYFLVNTLALGGLIGWTILSGASIAHAALSALVACFGARAPLLAPGVGSRAAVTVILFLAYELGYWLDHYLKHTVPALWQLHKPHHTAEALTPLTVFRVHPLDTLIFTNVLAVVGGLASGLSSYAFGGETRAFVFDGANVLFLGFMYGYVHLQHSEFWIPIRGPLGRVFMSPAHHQIHHSMSPAHFNRNFGSCLALFDWLFGTLIIPAKDSPRLRFGVNEPDADPHTVTALFIDPIREAAAALGASEVSSWRRWRFSVPPNANRTTVR